MTPAESQDAHVGLLGGLWHRLCLTLETIRFAHTVFALPFALLAALVAADGWPSARQTAWILVACVCARSAAMSFNRLHDLRYDRLNPRTKDWPLAAGRISPRFVVVFCLVNVAGFVLAAGMLNRLALWLSPLALLVLLGYSTTKRWLSGTHFVLGLALAIAPIGAWIGVRGSFDLAPLLLAAGVLAWVAGFDIIYACQDQAFDRRVGLRSLPAWLGVRRALRVSVVCHVAAALLFAAFALVTPLDVGYLSAVALAAALLAWEQSIVSPTDLSRLKQAFFTINGWVGILIFIGGAVDILA